MPASAHHAEDARFRNAQRVLDVMDRWSDRLAGHHDQRRTFPRCTVRLPLSGTVPGVAAGPGEAAGQAFQGWTRNISRCGLGFIVRQKITALEVLVCLPGLEQSVWMRARIIRARMTHDGFWEYGVRFVGRAGR